MSDKKSYKDKNGTTRVGDFLRGIKENVKEYAPELLDIAGNVTGIDALENLADKIRGTEAMPERDKEIALAMIQKDIEDMKQQTEREKIAAELEGEIERQISERWKADMGSDSWLSKNVRPLLVLFLVLSLVSIAVVDSVHGVGFTVEDVYKMILKDLTIASVLAYFGARTLDKFKGKKVF